MNPIFLFVDWKYLDDIPIPLISTEKQKKVDLKSVKKWQS